METKPPCPFCENPTKSFDEVLAGICEDLISGKSTDSALRPCPEHIAQFDEGATPLTDEEFLREQQEIEEAQSRGEKVFIHRDPKEIS